MRTTLLRTQWPRLPEKLVRQLQAEKLRRYLRDVVLPFSAHYRAAFQERGLTADSIRTLEDLEKVPFTSKADFTNTPNHPNKAKEFILIPDQNALADRVSTIWRALLSGRSKVQRGFEFEFRPIFLTSTTGRSADPVPFLYTNYDLQNLSSGGERIMQICNAQREMRLLN